MTVQESVTASNDLVAVLAPLFALGLAVVHLFAGRLRFLDTIPRSRWLSAAGGVSVSYVFVHVLPDLQRAGETIERSETLLTAIEHHVYLIVLVGFTVFYGLERLVSGTRDRDETQNRDGVLGQDEEGDSEEDGVDETDTEETGVVWLHLGSFAAYNALIGYLLLHREEPGVVSLSTFFVAMALHFVVNDYGLREHHGETYRRYGRWLLSAAVLLGLAVGYVTTVDELLLSVLFAFLAGGIVLNVIKEELPSERQSRFWAFAVGVVGYAVILLTV